ncbi:HTH-type transcriptional regulator iscR [Rickettsiales bacterium Ac37b]|nr:HTH-type transcriptional regulator iscR [Rickettsiales bacterium Ac37b]
MILGSKGRYAVMAMVEIAMQDNLGLPMSLDKIAIRQNIKLNYLEQIFMKLRKNGLVRSSKGPGGGYILNKNSAEISIASIVEAVEEPIKMVRCDNQPGMGCMPNGKRCVTHDLWDGLSNQIFIYLNSISLQDLSNNAKSL